MGHYRYSRQKDGKHSAFNNALDVELAKSVGPYFRLSEKEMVHILDEVKSSVSGWQRLADQTGIPRSEQTLMAAAFRV